MIGGGKVLYPRSYSSVNPGWRRAYALVEIIAIWSDDVDADKLEKMRADTRSCKTDVCHEGFDKGYGNLSKQYQSTYTIDPYTIFGHVVIPSLVIVSLLDPQEGYVIDATIAQYDQVGRVISRRSGMRFLRGFGWP